MRGKRDYARAIAGATKAIGLDRKCVWAYLVRAAVHNAKGEYGIALADANEAIRMEPKAEECYRMRAYVYRDRGEFDKALADALRAIELSPDPYSYDSRASAHSHRGDVDAAIRDYSTGLKLDPGNPTCHGGRGWNYMRKGQFAKALADLNRAVDLSPLAASYDNRAWAFFHSGELASAERHARKALTLDPKHTWLRAVLFRIEVAKGHRAGATKQARQFLSVAPADPDAKSVHLLLRYFLGEVPLDTLRRHPHWRTFHVAVRGYKGAAPKP